MWIYSVPLPPFLHPECRPSAPAAGRRPAVRPDTPWSADGNAAPTPHWTGPLMHQLKSAVLKAYNQTNILRWDARSHHLQIFIRGGGRSVHTQRSHGRGLWVHRLFVISEKGINYDVPLMGKKVEWSNRLKTTLHWFSAGMLESMCGFLLTVTVSLNAPFKNTSMNSVREKMNSSFCIKSFKLVFKTRLRIQFSHQTNPNKPFPPLLALNFFYVFSSSAIFLDPGGNRNKEWTPC